MYSKYVSMSDDKKATIWYAICNILQKGVIFITTPVITRLLSTDDYGVYSVFLSWRDILIIFATLNLYQGVFTKILVDNKHRQDECTSSIQGLGWFFSFVFAFIYVLFREKVNSTLGQDTLSMSCLILYFFFFPAYSLWCTKQRVNYKYKKMVVVTIVLTFATPLLTILLLLTTELRADAAIVGSVLCYGIGGVIFSILNIYKGKILYVKRDWMYAVRFNVPLIPHYLAMIVLAHSDVIMIKLYCGETKAGMYSLAYQIASVMNVLYIAINNSFVPKSFELLKSNMINILNVKTNKLLVLTGVFMLLLIMISPEFLGVMGGDNYRDAVYVIPPVSCALYLMFCYGFFNNIEFYFEKTSYLMAASSISAILNLLLNLMFIPIFGYLVAAYTTLVCYAILLVVHYLFSHKICLKQFGEDVYNWKGILSIILIMFLGSIISLVSYCNDFARWIMVVCFVIALYKKRYYLLGLL